jgi:hypothetical protein
VKLNYYCQALNAKPVHSIRDCGIIALSPVAVLAEFLGISFGYQWVSGI